MIKTVILLLHTAAMHCHVNCVNILLNAGTDVNKPSSNGLTALSIAAFAGGHKCVDSLLKSGADVNLVDSDGDTAVMRAARLAHYKCVHLLIKAGTDVNVSNNEDITVLIAAVWKYHSYCGELIKTIGDCYISGNKYVPEDHSHEKYVDLLIQAEANVNSHSLNGNTALIAAVENGYHKCIELLLKAGADVNKMYQVGFTAPNEAAFLCDFQPKYSEGLKPIH